MSAAFNLVRPDLYADSVALMQLSMRLAALPGIHEASVMMGSPANLEILAEAGLLAEAGRTARANDLVVAIRAADPGVAASAAEQALAWLAQGPAARDPGADWAPCSFGAAARLAPRDLALISVPGEYAALEAFRALAAGLHVMVFSDNVSLADERALKRRARTLDRLVMGPDCGTALLAGLALGFVNAVPRGDTGIVAASGTGAQELSVLLARAGLGVSHIIGVGGRDLSAEVGGLATTRAVNMLGRDPATARLALISKPPAPAVAEAVLRDLEQTGKPWVACFVGASPSERYAVTLERAAALLGATPGADPAPPAPKRGGAIRGLFSGGTLCAEAQAVLAQAGVAVRSNVAIAGRDSGGPGAHQLLDLGADEFTRGKPHPMIEPGTRIPHLAAALNDPSVGVILLDVVLGRGSHADPATPVAETIRQAGPDRPPVVAYVCGLEGDPQDYGAQRAALERAGVVLAPSNAAAARVSLRFTAGKPSRAS